MTDLLAAETLKVGAVVIFTTASTLIIRIVFLTLVLAHPTAIRLLVRLSTAPVHIPSPQTGVNPTTPHKVVLLRVVLTATLTLLDSAVEFALSLNHFLDPGFHLGRLLYQEFVLALQTHHVFELALVQFCLFAKLVLQFLLHGLHTDAEVEFLDVEVLLHSKDVFGVFSEPVSLSNE